MLFWVDLFLLVDRVRFVLFVFLVVFFCFWNNFGSMSEDPTVDVVGVEAPTESALGKLFSFLFFFLF